MSGRRLHAVQETSRGRNTAREERETGEEDATRYIIVGSWHSSRTRRSLIHAWNSRESHEATRLRACSHAVGIAGEIYLCFRNFQTVCVEFIMRCVEITFFARKQRIQISFRVKMYVSFFHICVVYLQVFACTRNIVEIIDIA